MVLLIIRTEGAKMLRTKGTFTASCDFGWKAADPQARCADRRSVEVENVEEAATTLRILGWTISRTTDPALIEYHYRPQAVGKREWRASPPVKSGYGVRCPLHANTRTVDGSVATMVASRS